MGLPLRFWLLTGTISLGSISAFAADTKPYPSCTTTPTEADRKAAQGAFAAGNGSFNEADYATAITYWRDSYRRDCTAHALLLNLASAYERKGDRPEAINALETYLQRKPDDPTADQIQRRIQKLRAESTASTAPVPTAAPATTALPPAPTAGQQLPPPPPESYDARPSRSATPLILAGGGVVVALIGGIMLPGGLKKISNAEEICPDRKKCSSPAAEEEGNAGVRQVNISGVLLGIGLVATAGGVIWYLSSGKSKPTATNGAPLVGKMDVSPVLDRGFAGVSLGGRF